MAVGLSSAAINKLMKERNTMNRLVVSLLIVLAVSTTFSENPQSPSPAERTIAQARRLIEKNPKNFEAYNALALALSRRARETSDVNYYTQAEQTLRQSFAISPDNFDGARIQVWLLLGKHEFTAALDEARKLNKRMPDDVMTYGFLTDANVELGNYNEAETSAQRMLDLRPGNLPALTRAAYLRELLGDVDGSLELMNMAVESTPLTEVEDRAWILAQMAHLDLSTGKTADAEHYLQQALTLFPGYHYALGNLAKVRIQQQRYAEAVQLLQQRYQAAPHAENLFDLAEALQLAGRSDDSKKAFAEFEQKSLQETNRADNSNRELIFYYADYAHRPARSLEVAEREFARRQDVYTLDAYAWALHVNGRDQEARRRIEDALAVGIRDAKVLWHAGEIALAAGDRAAAEKYLQQAANLNAVESRAAKVTLTRLTGAGRQRTGGHRQVASSAIPVI
jgi:tetratricopeptide (TPR) repeat protein